MSTPKISILTFPQELRARKLLVNILVLPRNINPLTELEPGSPAFADAVAAFKPMLINSLDGLPTAASPVLNPPVSLIDPANNRRAVWEALRLQLEKVDKLKIDQAETQNPARQAAQSLNDYKERSIRKYLPESYRAAFNFSKPRTKYATLGDEYHCSVKNSGHVTDTSSVRDVISWGKAIALCLRNPVLARKAGLIYTAEITLGAGMFDEGGWLYFDMGAGSGFATLNKSLIKPYAARIPALKGISARPLFAAVQFPVSAAPVAGIGYDEIMREAMLYDDGFAKIVHANQPVNDYLLEENDKSNPPQKDIGIRLGWDDEQLTIWQNRQMLQKDEVSNEDVDAPLGVFSYCVDVKKTTDTLWRSQNKVVAPAGIIVQGGLVVAEAGKKVELGSEVHPTAHGNSKAEGFWLPMYFANWMGKSLAIPDTDAQEIYKTKSDTIVAPQSRYANKDYYIKELKKTPAEADALVTQYIKANSSAIKPKQVFNMYVQDPEHSLALEYGTSYDFRVRLMDISGGTPPVTEKPIHAAAKSVDTWHFKRHTVAAALDIVNIHETAGRFKDIQNHPPAADISYIENIYNPAKPNVLTIKRPGLAYPAVAFTGKYKSPDAVTRLKNLWNGLGPDKERSLSPALPDPDVKSFKVLVEVKSLEMDNALSAKGDEPFILLYEKEFSFNADFDTAFDLKIVYKAFDNVGLGQVLASTGGANELTIPSARHCRLTFIPIVSGTDGVYADESIRFGHPKVLRSYKIIEENQPLLSAVEDGLKALYLQPEGEGHSKPAVSAGNISFIYPQKQIVKSSTPIEIKRIADALDLDASNLTLQGPKGVRVQLGCSHKMRHSLAPDSSSITFSSLAEVFNHWVIAVRFTLNRDWAWDGLQVESFKVMRSVGKTSSLAAKASVGTINVSETVNIGALINADRERSELIFIDVVDPKEFNGDFPSELFVEYQLQPQLKNGINIDTKEIGKVAMLNLPVTAIPAQIPRLVSSGIALSEYLPGDKYSSTSVRQKFLWLEFEKPVADPNDTYFVRVLANAPDPILCKVDLDLLFHVPEEPPLNIDPEKIRAIIPGMDNDYAAIGAMQEMIPDDSKKTFYMLPLPAGLHSESDELFGFFTYEIRVGHKKELWSTAQGRYGRPLKVNGVQHPAPSLVCNAFRRKYREGTLMKNEIAVTAPFANAVLNGKNVTPEQPRTSLFAFLYAQVKQADGKAYRNILLGSKMLHFRKSKFRTEEGNKLGTCAFKQHEVSKWLRGIGLPVSCSMSVLCVEMFPLNNAWDTDFSQPEIITINLNESGMVLFDRELVADAETKMAFFSFMKAGDNVLATDMAANAATGAVAGSNTNDVEVVEEEPNPLIQGLGRFRIYRTSALVPVDNICCDDC